MRIRPDFRVGPFRVTGGGGLTLLIVLGVLLVCCPWSAVVEAITR